MKNNNNKRKEAQQNSELLNSLLRSITPEQQRNTDRKMLLAAKIYDAMKAKGWNQKTLAEKMGKQPSEISKWLSGTHSFTSDTLWSIGDILRVDLLPVSDQVTGKGEAPINLLHSLDEEEVESVFDFIKKLISNKKKVKGIFRKKIAML